MVVMALWTLGSALYALPLRGLRRALGRRNGTLWLANWTVFGTGKERAGIARYALVCRDTVAAEPGPWVAVASGRPWVWHACLWQPERRLADRLHRIGQEISRAIDGPVDAAAFVGRRRELLSRFLDRKRLRPAGAGREFRLIERRSSVGEAGADARIEERVILKFGGDDDAAR